MCTCSVGRLSMDTTLVALVLAVLCGASAAPAALDEILVGLDSFQFTTVIRRHPKAFPPLFTFLQPAAKTALSLEDI